MRVLKPELIKSMEQSFSRFHQLSPIVVREAKDNYQIIDGFKRYHAALKLGWPGLSATVVQTTVKAATAMMITYNKNNNSLNDYEEAMILLSLKKNHNMQQEDIAKLVGFSVSWVSRRLALVEKLEPAVKDELKLGVITSTQARDISKLPRGNQFELTKCIVDNGLSSRQTSAIIDQFQKHKNRDKQKFIIDHPLKILEKKSTTIDDDYDSRLTAAGNNLLKSIKRAFRQINFLNNNLLGGLGNKLTLLDWSILEKELTLTTRVSSELIEIINNNPNKTR
ncbi:MAG: ParB/RepB/Spo0J family partition protein [Candidatus Omnitrophica bacterium]|nr:ParB/RepB/Spo0J family partition protein [Candidatus Omnitrophota bacterium]